MTRRIKSHPGHKRANAGFRVLMCLAFAVTASESTYPQNAPPDTWEKSAVEVVGWFETLDDHGWGVVAGDFDCNGISAGVLQWNVGTNSLNGLINKFSEAALAEFMPTYGLQFRQKINSPTALAYVRSFQTYKNPASCNGNLRKAAWTKTGTILRDELSALLASDEGKTIQLHATEQTARNAWLIATQWSFAKRGLSEPTFQEFVFFFDTVNFNGKLFNEANYASVYKFINSLGSEAAYGKILKYLRMNHANQYQVKDAIHNSELWRTKTPTMDDLELIVSGYLEGKSITKKKSIPFRLITIARRGTIVFNDGYVNTQRKSFEQLAESKP